MEKVCIKCGMSLLCLAFGEPVCANACGSCGQTSLEFSVGRVYFMVDVGRVQCNLRGLTFFNGLCNGCSDDREDMGGA